MKRYCLLACLLGCGVAESVQKHSTEALDPFADLTCGTPILPGGLTAEHFDALQLFGARVISSRQHRLHLYHVDSPRLSRLLDHCAAMQHEL